MDNNQTAPRAKRSAKGLQKVLAALLSLGLLAALTYFGPQYGVPHYATLALCLAAVFASVWAMRRAKSGEAFASLRGTLSFVFMGSAWTAFVNALYVIAGAPRREELEINILAPQANFFGHSVSSAVLWTWAVMAVLAAGAAAFRFLLFPRFSETPSKMQNAFEAMVEWIEGYAAEKSDHDYGPNLGAYTFSIAALLIGCASLELLKVLAPTADVTVTGAFAICSFGLFNYYSFKRLGLKGKLKWYFEPTPILAPIKFVIDIAKPVSLACRLYGNMLGGFIIMDLFYVTFNYSSAGFQGLLGVFFNIFHPLVQVLIFVTLSLTYIAEATE
jgi:F-type H+-transporting ATPase subunit a